jgi:hypothetical protein
VSTAVCANGGLGDNEAARFSVWFRVHFGHQRIIRLCRRMTPYGHQFQRAQTRPWRERPLRESLGCSIRLTRNFPRLASANGSDLAPIRAVGLRGAAIKVGPLLNGKRLVMNIANYMRLRLKHHFTALNWTLYSTVHNHSLSSDASDDLRLWGDNE